MSTKGTKEPSKSGDEERKYTWLDLALFREVPESAGQYEEVKRKITEHVEELSDLTAKTSTDLLWEFYQDYKALGIYIGMAQISQEIGYFETPKSLEFSTDELPELPPGLLESFGEKLCDSGDLKLLLGHRVVRGAHFAVPDYIQRNMYVEVREIDWSDNTAEVVLSRDRDNLETSDSEDLSIVGFGMYRRGRIIGQELLLGEELWFHRYHDSKEPKQKQPIAVEISKLLTTGRLAGDNLNEEDFYELVGAEMQAIFGYTELADLRASLNSP
jgi:hypothetical protein